MGQNKQTLTRQLLWLPIAVLIISLFAYTAGLRAQDGTGSGNGLRINNLRQEFELSPGQSEVYTIEVENASPSDLTIQAFINDFESDGESGQPRLLVNTSEPTPFSLINYVTLPEPFTLAPREKKEVQVGINLPEDLPPGGYFGAIRFAPVDLNEGDGNVALTASIASLLLVNVPGEVREAMELQFMEARRVEGNEVTTGRIFEFAPNQVAVSLRNSGNSILKPYGRISVSNIFGNEVYSYEFNTVQGSRNNRDNVLPASSRTFTNNIENIGFIGRYTVEGNLAYGAGGGNIITASTSFWVIPWRVLAVIFLALVAAIWFGTKGIKSYNRRIVERAKRNS